MKPEDEYPTEDQVKELIEYSRANDRVCPMPGKWNELWETFPGKRRIGVGWEPALPLILAAWYDTSALLKILRLTDHIEYAAKHGAFTQVDEFLRGLKEEEWAHLSEI